MPSTNCSRGGTAEARLSQIGAHLATPDGGSQPSNLQEASKAANTTAPSQDAPALILVFGWAGAPLSAVTKFAKPYESMFPSAKILYFSSSPAVLFPWPMSTVGFPQQDVKDLVTATATLNPTDNILVHVLSGGGATKFAHAASAYRKKTGRPLPIRLLVTDSTPTEMGISTRIPSLTDDIILAKSGLAIRTVMRPILILALASIEICGYAIGQPDPERIHWEGLLDPTCVPAEARRGYIYSEADHIIPAAGVERHMELAKKRGLDVEAEKFVKTRHLGHAKADPERYWTFVKRRWELP